MLLILILFLILSFTSPALATKYFEETFESYTIGTTCGGNCSIGKFYWAGCSSEKIILGTGSAKGTKHLRTYIGNGQDGCYTEISSGQSPFPISYASIAGKTMYFAYYVKMERIGGNNIFGTAGTSSSKNYEMGGSGSGIRWTTNIGCGSDMTNAPNTYSIYWGNPSDHLNNDARSTCPPCPNLEVGSWDNYYQNYGGYNVSNNYVMQYDRWYAVVIAVKMNAVQVNPTGTFAGWVNGTQVMSYSNMCTALNSSSSIGLLDLMGTCQGCLAAHYEHFDGIMLTDNWADIVDGGYLTDPEGDTAPSKVQGLTITGGTP